MEISEELKTFLHDISNDATVAEGYLKVCASGRKSEEEKDEYIKKCLVKVRSLTDKVRDFKELTR